MSEIALFPLPLVVFPGGRLPLQIFETRYLDMVKRCMRANTGFGVVMITEGNQLLQSTEEQLPVVSQCGTYCTIVDFDQLSNGMLSIMVEGQKKFVIRDQYEQADRLMLADVEFLAVEEEVPVPEEQEHLSSLLESLMSHEAVQRLGLHCDLGQAFLVELDKLVERIQKTNE
jgi:Lon protease-like protein